MLKVAAPVIEILCREECFDSFAQPLIIPRDDIKMKISFRFLTHKDHVSGFLETDF